MKSRMLPTRLHIQYLVGDTTFFAFSDSIHWIIILAEKNLIADPFAKVKVILRDELTAKIELETQFASKTAIEAIKKAGGSFKKVAVPARKKQAKEDK